MLAAPRGHGSDGVPWEKYGTNRVKIWGKRGWDLMHGGWYEETYESQLMDLTFENIWILLNISLRRGSNGT